MSWFDQQDPCPECGHYNFDAAACAVQPGGPVVECTCAHEAHFTGRLDAGEPE
jgi:hypothetical protein